MKKYMVVCAGLCLAMSLTGCKSKDSAYKQAYEKAKAAEAAQNGAIENAQTTETPVVTPVKTVTYDNARVVSVDKENVKEERVSLVNGTGLHAYSVVVGAFQLITHAENLQQRLKNAGYSAQIVKNEERNMYRVVASTFDDKAAAVQSRDQLRSSYPDAWLLYSTK